MPDNKKLNEIKWLAIYDIWSQNTFGDIYIPRDFELPNVQKIPKLEGKSNSISSGSVEIVDAKTIRLPEFKYDGRAKGAFFWVGVGPQPGTKGHVVPDEHG